MKVLVEIEDSQLGRLIDVLRQLPVVNITPVQEPAQKKAQQAEKPDLLADLKVAVDQMKQIKQGKKIGRPAEELINEL